MKSRRRCVDSLAVAAAALAWLGAASCSVCPSPDDHVDPAASDAVSCGVVADAAADVDASARANRCVDDATARGIHFRVQYRVRDAFGPMTLATLTLQHEADGLLHRYLADARVPHSIERGVCAGAPTTVMFAGATYRSCMSEDPTDVCEAPRSPVLAPRRRVAHRRSRDHNSKRAGRTVGCTQSAPVGLRAA